jgi:hypothetical protein
MVSIYAMRAGVWNLVIGLLAIGAAASGFVLPFTDQPMYLAGVGAAIAILGGVQLIRSRGR